jgi:hypothetical protein
MRLRLFEVRAASAFGRSARGDLFLADDILPSKNILPSKYILPSSDILPSKNILPNISILQNLVVGRKRMKQSRTKI